MTSLAGIGSDLAQSIRNQPESTRNELTEQDFLTLLVTQLQAQSPTDPFDTNTMMEQVSQLTALNANTALKESVSGLVDNFAASQALQAAQLVGHYLQTESEYSQLDTEQGLRGSVVLETQASNLNVEIKDSTGTILKTLNLGDASSGVVDFKWDGTDELGNGVPAGIYQITARAQMGGEEVGLPTAGVFKVESVTLNNNGSDLLINAEGVGRLNMQDILKIM
jgi:flagellar basal-body rod modification protein FlgD